MKTIEKKEPYLNILNVQGNIYEHFTPDQVLTHKNLNKIVDYFEDQDRLTRILLNGVGVGGGLNILTHTKEKIEIGQGFGITTDGDLIKTETREFLNYSKLLDKGDYDLFKNIKAFEILSQEGAGRANELPLSSFNATEGINLNECVVLAYVESYTDDGGLCSGFGCDDSGDKVYNNLKFLLTHKSNYSKLIANDTVYKNHNVLSYYDTLPELCIQRLLLNSDNTNNAKSIHDLYRSTFFADKLASDLKETVLTIINQLKHRINFKKFGINNSEISTLFEKVFPENFSDIELDIQYKYDFLKDLLETYHQIRDLLLHLHYECVPTIHSFPKHLLLGTLSETTRLQTRHKFYPSPITTGNDENLMTIRTLFIKFYNQLKEFKIPKAESAAIKITPSKSYNYKLSDRSIPYYYQTTKALVANWNPSDKKNRRPTLQLGYHKNNLKNIPCVQKPLEYTHLDKDFYRIEGHLGKDFRTALNKVQSLKREYNLAFDVKTISIGFPVSSINLDDSKCDTTNYATMLNSWKRELDCSADSAIDFFKEYKITAIGENFTPTKLRFTSDIKAVVAVAETPTINPIIRPKNEIFTAISVTNKSIGSVVSLAVSEVNPVFFNVASINANALEIFTDQPETNANEEEIELYVKIPIKIISNLIAVKETFLKGLNSLYQTNKLIAFYNAIEKLESDLKTVVYTLSKQSEESTFGTRTHDKMYEYFIYELLKLRCFKEKINWLKTKLDEIRNDLYRDLILSNLIEKHPGLEHMAGVPKGGTFFMVYLGDNGQKFKKTKRKKASKFSGQILFDFALPYACTSNCPPDTIVYQPISEPTPEPTPALTISPKTFCIIEGEEEKFIPIPITLIPENGKLDSKQGTGFIIGDVGEYKFNPAKVNLGLLGEPITFQINGKTVEESIHVYKLPKEVKAEYKVVEWNDSGVIINLKATHKFEDKNYFKYEWKRKDGRLLSTSITDKNVLLNHSEKTIDEIISLTVTVNNVETDCSIEALTIVKESRPAVTVVDTNTLKLSCDISFKERMSTFDIDEILNEIDSRKLKPKGAKGEIITPTINVLKALNKTKQTELLKVSFIKTQLDGLNNLRNILLEKFTRPSFNENDKNSLQKFILVDQSIELIGLELLRCVELFNISGRRNDIKTISKTLNTFFEFSQTTSGLLNRFRIPRSITDKKYIKEYNAKSELVSTSFKANIK